MQLDNDSIVSDNVEEMEDKQQISPKEKLFQSDTEDENDEYPSNDEHDQDEEMDSEDEKEALEDIDDNNDELLPIEKANIRLKKKQEKEWKLAEEEMTDMTLQQCVFTFPTEEELAADTNLKDIQQRIKDVVIVLSDFKRLRDTNKDLNIS
ncbi:26S rRNA (cytosine-C(5))-methyltransferase nsun-1, partial [Anthophora plagiata]